MTKPPLTHNVLRGAVHTGRSGRRFDLPPEPPSKRDGLLPAACAAATLSCVVVYGLWHLVCWALRGVEVLP